jgi:hypothetical protein
MCRRGEKEWVALIDTTGLGEAWRVLTKNPEREALAYAAGLVPPARRSRAKAMDRMVISDE